jgi:hypothetical protein
MMGVIKDYPAKECDYNLDCVNCEDIEECYHLASMRCNSEWAESVDYCGCKSEEEFWEMLFD